MSSSAMDEFVREGLRRYASACEAISVFEEEVHARLLRRIREKEDWANFSRPEGEDVGNRSKGTDWLAAILYSADGSSYVDLGLWWRTPVAKDGVVAYCCFYAGGRRISLELESPRHPVKCGPIDDKKKRLYAVLSGSENLDEVLDLLLVEMDRALKPKVSA